MLPYGLATVVCFLETGSLSPCGSCDRISRTLGSIGQQTDMAFGASSYVIEGSHKLQSSPGYLQVGQVPSKWTWQIPQTSSSGISHLHVATAFHFLIVTFIFELAGTVDKANLILQGLFWGLFVVMACYVIYAWSLSMTKPFMLLFICRRQALR